MTTTEVDATELTREEWFALWALFGLKPGAAMKDAHEWRMRSLGMPPKQQQLMVRMGVESLIARKLLVPEKDEHGNPVLDAEGNQVWKGIGRIVSRMREVLPVSSTPRA